MKYEPLPTPCNVSFVSLEEAAIRVGPSFVYELHVCVSNVLYARNVLKDLAATTRENPLAPYVNLVVDHSYGRDEWSLHANGKACGTEGC